MNGGVELYWKITDDQIEIALKSDGQGYIGFGFGHSMKNCDIYLGWVSSDGKVTMMDTWTTEQDVPPSDESQGGKNDILGKMIIFFAVTYSSKLMLERKMFNLLLSSLYVNSILATPRIKL